MKKLSQRSRFLITCMLLTAVFSLYNAFRGGLQGDTFTVFIWSVCVVAGVSLAWREYKKR